MMRKLAMIIAVACVATVFTVVFALGLLWYRGQLTSDAVEAIVAIVKGEEPESSRDVGEADVIDPSANDVMQARVTRLLDIENREKEVDLLLGMVNERADALEAGQKAFVARTKAFDDRLAALEERWLSEATTQARAVIQKQQPADAVAMLSSLEIDEAVLLVRGLQDKTIAQIMQQFTRSNDEKEIERGRAIFEAIFNGEPRRALLDETVSADDAG